MQRGTAGLAVTGTKNTVSEGAYDGKRGMLVSRTNLLSRLLILVAVATLPAVLVTTYMQQNLREEGRERIASEALRQAELLNADLSSVVEGARQLSLAISHFANVRAGNPACKADIVDLRSDLPSYAMVSVIGDDGQIICSTEQGAPAFAPAADVAHVREIVNYGKFEVGTFMGATPSRGPILPLCQRQQRLGGRRSW